MIDRKKILFFIVLFSFVAARSQTATRPDTTAIFVAGTDGYKSYRIPAIVTTAKGTLLAFCEGRRNNAADAGDIDMLVKHYITVTPLHMDLTDQVTLKKMTAAF